MRIGDKKADYFNIDPNTKAVGAYINQCAGVGDPDIGDDPGTGHGGGDWTTAQCTDPVIFDASIRPQHAMERCLYFTSLEVSEATDR